VFYSQGQGMMKVSNIRITPWMENSRTKMRPAKNRRRTCAARNNDKVSGKLESIKDGNMQFVSSFAKLEIPLKRIEQVEFASTAPNLQSAPRATCGRFFVGRGQITFALEKWDDKGVSAKSMTFGTAIFSPQAFDRVQFNLDQQPAKTTTPTLPTARTSSRAME